MFGKDKVKAHNRVIKGKSGFKVTRIGQFLRKKDENNTKRNLAIGTAAVIGAGGVALLLRKKGLNTKSLLKTKYPKGVTVKTKNVVEDIKPKTSPPKTEVVKKQFDPLPDPWDTPIVKPKMRSAKLLVKKPTTQNRLRRKDNIPDPWETSIKDKNKIDIPSSDTIVKPESKSILLLPGKKIPASRGNLYGYDNRISRRVAKKVASDADRINSMEKIYESISPDNLAMKASIKIDHYLKRPRRTSNLGAPPKPTSLEKVISNPNTKQAQEKVKDRLSRAGRKLAERKLKKNDK